MLAISTSLEFACATDASVVSGRICLDDVSLLDGGHRWLLAKIAAPLFQVLVLVVHGLDKIHGAEKIEEFWGAILKTLSLHSIVGEPVIAFVDGNCRICEGMDVGDICGSRLEAACKRTFVSDCLLSFCSRAGFSIANTFDEHVQAGASLGSYHVSSGMTVACDYVLHSDTVAVVPGSLKMLENLKMDNKKADHRPLSLSVGEV